MAHRTHTYEVRSTRTRAVRVEYDPYAPLVHRRINSGSVAVLESKIYPAQNSHFQLELRHKKTQASNFE